MGKKLLFVQGLFHEILYLLLGVIVATAYTILVISLSPIYVFRFLLCKTSSFLNPSLGKMVTARGQLLAAENFTSGKPTRAAIVIGAALRGHQSIDSVKTLVNDNFVNAKLVSGSDHDKLKFPELQQYVTTWMGFRFWKPESGFNIDEHVKLYQPKDKIPFTDNHFRDFIEDLINRPFEPEKSPWEFYVTNNYVDPSISKEVMTLITIRTHHCLSDGFGLLHALVEQLGKGVPSVPTPKYATRASLKEVLYQITFPVRAMYELSRFAVMSTQNHPWKVPDEKKSWKELYSKTPIISIEKIKAIKNRFGVSFSSVVQSACAAASRATMLRLYGKAKGDVETIPCLWILPLPDHPKLLRNHMSGAYIRLPTNDSDPVERLKECDKQLTVAKNSTMPFLGKYLPIIGGSLTASLAAALGKNRSFPVAISSFAIGDVEYEWMERNLVHVTAGAGAQVGVVGVNFVICTYAQGIQFSCTAEASLVTQEDIEQLTQCIMNEIETLFRWSTVDDLDQDNGVLPFWDCEHVNGKK